MVKNFTWQVVLGCAVAVSLIFFIIPKTFSITIVRADTPAKESSPETRVGERVSRCLIPGLGSMDQYRAYLHQAETTCKDLRQFGGKKPAPPDGMKLVCMDSRFNIKPGKCLVFSFGVNNEWSFEDEFDKFGCKVYAYDPTMGKEDHQRSPNVRFFATGIGNYKGIKKVGMGNKWSDQKDMLFNSPHILAKIKQIGMEVHDGPDRGLGQTTTQQVFWPYFMLMQCMGFKLIHTRNAGGWREVVWARDF